MSSPSEKTLVVMRSKPVTDAEVAVFLESLARFDEERRKIREQWSTLFERLDKGARLEDGCLTGLLRVADEVVDGGRRRVLLINERRPEEI